MSNWIYVGLAYGVTYIVLTGYTIYLVRARARVVAAAHAQKQRMEV